MNLEQLHIDVSNVIAGLAGGAVNSIVFGRSNIWAVIGSMICGAFTANYLAESFSKLTGWTVPTAAFIVGVAGMAIIQAIVAAAKNWRPTIPGQPGQGGQDQNGGR